jgi:hypothetical protein
LLAFPTMTDARRRASSSGVQASRDRVDLIFVCPQLKVALNSATIIQAINPARTASNTSGCCDVSIRCRISRNSFFMGAADRGKAHLRSPASTAPSNPQQQPKDQYGCSDSDHPVWLPAKSITVETHVASDWPDHLVSGAVE